MRSGIDVSWLLYRASVAWTSLDGSCPLGGCARWPAGISIPSPGITRPADTPSSLVISAIHSGGKVCAPQHLASRGEKEKTLSRTKEIIPKQR